MTREENVKNTLDRRTENIFPNRETVVQRLSGNEPLTLYYGIDPTGPNIHLGHTVQLLLLKDLARLGHKIIIILGGFTARIGDPTDKDATRTQLTEKQVKENAKTYKEQISKIFKDVAFETRDNAKWLAGLSLEDVINLASHVTVQQMLTRDMFQDRIKKKKPIFVHEFLYPLMQGYDSVAMEVDGEVGGNDQTFNMLVGRDLERILLGRDKLVLVTRLLADAKTGKKMSKSEGSVIALDDSPQEIRRKVLNDIDDKVVKTVFELCTEKEQSWIDREAEGDPRVFKETLADELVRMYHGEQRINEARQELVKRLPAGNHTPGHALFVWGVTSSVSAGHRLIKQGAVKLNGEKITDLNKELKAGDKIKVGSGKFIRVEE